MKQADVKYKNGIDELHIVFEEADTPIVYKLDNNVMLEFNNDILCSIVLPNFQQMMGRIIEDETFFDLSNLELVDELMIITIDVNGDFNMNVKVDISSLK